MNHTELIRALSLRTGIDEETCDRLIRAFEDLLSEELAGRPWKSRAFDLAVELMNTVQRKKDARRKAL